MRVALARGLWVTGFGWFLATAAFGQNEQLVLRVEGPEGELTTGSEFGAAVFLDSELDGIQGWSFAIEHDPDVLELTAAEASDFTLQVNNGEEPDFLVVNTELAGSPGVAMAVVVSFVTPVFVDAGENYELLDMSYSVVGDPTVVDPCKPLETELAFSDTIGDPPVTNALTVDGATERPVLLGAPVTVRCPGNIEFTRCEGDTDNVYLEWTFGGTPTWDFLFLYRDGEFLAMLEPEGTSFDDLALEPGGYAYTLVTIVVKDPFNPTLIFASCVATVIPITVDSIEPPIGYWIGGDTVTIRGQAFTTAEMTTVTFTAPGEEPLLLEVLDVTGENEITALTPRAPRVGFYDIRVENERGFAELASGFEYGFIRGEINADGSVDLSDAVLTLDFLFLGKADDPPCLDATDVTDDGLIDISDAIAILGFLFLGADPPLPPYPGPGSDPTPDDPFGCLDGS